MCASGPTTQEYRRTRKGEFEVLHLGHYRLNWSQVIFMQEAGPSGELSGAIGGGILQHFTVIFHYGRQQLSIEAHGSRPKPVLNGINGSPLLNGRSAPSFS